ncbi:DAPG hydrolase family protein [Lutimonas sp.]|uniref:DAPG hydrolase family protein n=1 Tax=Lutimonas sp. TaxID=1872403 RepID=UPI003D9BB86A
MSLKSIIVVSFLLVLAACNVGEIADPKEYPITLSETEKTHPLAKYYYSVEEPSNEQYETLVYREPEDGLPFDEAGKMLEEGYLTMENGYTRFKDGSGYVAVNIQFPEATGEMLDWWFDWHGYDSMRYKIWYPGLHAFSLYENYEEPETFSISKYVLENPEGKTTHTIEAMMKGEDLQDLQITFVNPEQFGLDNSKLGTNQWAICANVKSGNLTIVQMVHFVRKTENGVEMRSRFWVGNDVHWIVRKIGISEDKLYGLAHHCLTEYTQLASFLPQVYSTYALNN